MSNYRALRIGALFLLIGGVLALSLASGLRWFPAFGLRTASEKHALTQNALAAALKEPVTFYKFPTEIELPGDIVKTAGLTSTHTVLQYSFDAKLQESMVELIRSYGPDYGGFVAIDPETGRVLSMISFSRQPVFENIALKASFPSASVFKVVTAAAAIEEKKFSGDTVISFSGANHTLYKGNILKTVNNRWTRHMTLREAFAKSVNTVFGRIGAYSVGSVQLSDYASRFGFNRRIASEIPTEEGHAPIPQDAWGLAEAASGYTRENTMSPLQGALIAASIANDGTMMEPYILDSAFTADGNRLYSALPKVAGGTVDAATAAEIRALMRQTIQAGTSRHAFRGFFRGDLAGLDVGGKTGSLTGMDPPGKYDWFVGFADDNGGHKIAVAALTIHQKLWRVKSSFLARKAFEFYFHNRALQAKRVAVK